MRPLGAARGFEGEDDVEVVGRVTPRKSEQTVTPMLASSHKVMSRPRQSLRTPSPLKKSGAPHLEGIEIDDDDDELIPRKSPKAYFSSPISSTSSTSALNKDTGSPSLFAFDRSNPNFTINPEAFAPLFTSTQNGPEGDGSGGGVGRVLSRKGTGSSPTFLKFSSQFDLEKHVEDTVALLEKDVDTDKWFASLGGDADLAVGAED